MLPTGDRAPYIVGLGGTLRPGSSSARAVERALRAAGRAGARTTLLELDALELPLYRPDLPRERFGPGVARLLDAVRDCDGMIWSTSAYHGILAGATKNALDFLELLMEEGEPYLEGKTVGLISTAAGDVAAVNAVNSMIFVAHALRATVVPLSVPIPRASGLFGVDGEMVQHWSERLTRLGELVAEAGWARVEPQRGPLPSALAAP